MKIYNKKTFMSGVFLIVLGVPTLIINILEKGQKLLTFILYDVLVLKEKPFKISGNTSNAGRVAGTLSFP